MWRFWLMLLLLVPMQLFANIEAYSFDNTEEGIKKEERYRTLISELRCLVCQNQNLADSNAELAQDLRRQTYELVQKGDSVEEVVNYMVQRYGDFVLYRPPFNSTTMLLWVGPFVILAVGVIILLLFIRRRNREPVVQISSEEHARANSLLAKDE